MDQREIQDILFDLESKKDTLLSELDEVNELLQNEKNSVDEVRQLTSDKESLEYEIQELKLDIAVYTEMMDKLYPSEIGACGFTCDGRCQQCSGSESYTPLYEVFTAGDY